jgi:hypothetical protein
MSLLQTLEQDGEHLVDALLPTADKLRNIVGALLQALEKDVLKNLEPQPAPVPATPVSVAPGASISDQLQTSPLTTVPATDPFSPSTPHSSIPVTTSTVVTDPSSPSPPTVVTHAQAPAGTSLDDVLSAVQQVASTVSDLASRVNALETKTPA